MRCEYLVTSLSVAALIVLAPVAAIGQDTSGLDSPQDTVG